MRFALFRNGDVNAVSNDAPYYRRFPKDYNSDPLVQAMTDDQDLAYQRMMDASWELGFLPDDVEQLARVVRYDLERFKAAWCWPLIDCWPLKRNAGRYNPRLEKEREFMLSRAEKAKKAVHVRWKKHRKKLGIKENQPDTNVSPKNSSSNAQPILRPYQPEPEPEPELTEQERALAKQDLSSRAPTLPLSRSEGASKNDAPVGNPNPYKFVVYWQDANEKRDYGVTIEPTEAFKEFFRLERERLGWHGSIDQFRVVGKTSLERFVATYTKRSGRNGKTRGGALSPVRLTEELVAWIRKDLASAVGRQSSNQSKAEKGTEGLKEGLRRFLGNEA